MKCHRLYDEEPNNFENYDESKLKIFRSHVFPKPIKKLLPPRVIHVVRSFKTTIERGPRTAVEELRENPGCFPKRLCWDPILQHDEHLRADLIASLFMVGVIGYRRKIIAAVGVLFAKKKTPDAMRMVVDCRISTTIAIRDLLQQSWIVELVLQNWVCRMR